MKKIICAVFFVLLIISSCTRQLTEPKVFSIAGVVTLSGQSNYSGITVELYAAAEPDTTIANRQKRFPTVGLDVQNNQMFDHRLVDAAFSTTTDENGQFSFSDIPDGQYILVAEKANFGWRYVRQVDGSTELENIKLYPETTFSGAIETYEVWPADRHVVVSGNILIRDAGTLLIDKGCVIRMAGDYEIRADGGLQVNGTADDPVWFTANTPSKESGYIAWRGIVVNDNTFMTFARVDFAETGLRTSGAEFTVQHSLFSKTGSYGALLTHESKGTFENNALINCKTGLGVEGNSDVDINYNLFVQTLNSLYGTGLAINTSHATASDNVFSGFTLGCTFEFNTWGDFLHNYVDKCETGIFVQKASFNQNTPVVIKSNILQACEKTIIDIYNCNAPIVEDNNFADVGSGHFITGYAVHYSGDKVMSFPNNYWTLVDENDIMKRINIQDNYSATDPYAIIINPLQNQPVTSAGPR